ncbi:GntR family transcriptional regulator [Blastococcus atacamensis]|uniref:GntR family transcriptional regulator n=1 Tax=Blastococcus atacamensis TaxID=2070508 RepID=UPI001E41B76A|nr:GntR family transcriptional regulator [Blastococcus atacamensis]
MAQVVGGVPQLRSGVQARRMAEQRLRDEITRGVVAPGQRLVEPELGERYGVTRNSARLALDVLIAEGLVERIPNRGARVRIVSTAEAVAILECRQALDGLLAHKAALNATAGQIDGLCATLEQLQRAAVDQEPLGFWSLLQEHHRLVRASAGQAIASSLVERLQGQVLRHQFRLLLRPGQAERSLPDLGRVVDAVAQRRPDCAEAAARSHLQELIDALLRESAGG